MKHNLIEIAKIKCNMPGELIDIVKFIGIMLLITVIIALVIIIVVAIII